MPEEVAMVLGQGATVSEAEDTSTAAAAGAGVCHHRTRVSRPNPGRGHRGLTDRQCHQPYLELCFIDARQEM